MGSMSIDLAIWTDSYDCDCHDSLFAYESCDHNDYILIGPWAYSLPRVVFQAIEKMKFTTLFNLFIKFIFTIAVFLFIHDKNDYLLQPLLTTTGYLICGIGALFLILKRWGYTLYKPQKGEILKTIKGSTDVFLNSLMPNLYNSFP